MPTVKEIKASMGYLRPSEIPTCKSCPESIEVPKASGHPCGGTGGVSIKCVHPKSGKGFVTKPGATCKLHPEI